MAYPSKVDWWLVLLAVALPGWRIAEQWMVRGQPPLSFWLLLTVLAIFAVALVPTRYVLEGRTISIQCGLTGWECDAFPIDDIRSIRPTHMPLSAPALSLDRLKIERTFGRDVLISPRDKEGFLRAISAIRPELQWDGGALLKVN